MATYVTDPNGECVIPDKDFSMATEGITLSKPAYWEIPGGSGEHFMMPEAWINLAVKATKSYPDTSYLELKTSADYGRVSFTAVKAPKDSTVRYRLFGNQVNKINWFVYTRPPQCYMYCFGDTLSSGSLTVTPQKFETIASFIERIKGN